MAKDANLAARMARLAQEGRQMPAQQEDSDTSVSLAKSTSAQPPKVNPYTKRLPLTLTPQDHTELIMARAKDGIEATARIRAMVALWLEDEQLRQRVDARARELR